MGRRLALTVAVAAGLGGCGGPEPPLRDCTAVVWLDRAAGPASIVGSFSGWQPLPLPPLPYDADWMVARLPLPPGEHGYLIERDERRGLDPHNALTTFHGEQEVSLLLVGDCSEPRLRLDAVRYQAGELTIEGTFLAARSASPLGSVEASTRAGQRLGVELADAASGRVRVRGKLPATGKHSVTLVAVDQEGVKATARAAAWGSERHESGLRDARDEVIYQVMIDRFRGPGGSPLPPPPTPGSRAGGTLDGVRSALADGTLERLGVTALWLSPVYVNPSAAREGNDGHLYEGYHGYWPLESRAVDPRIGGEEALEALVTEAHDASLALLLDLVPNHVYEDNPRYLEHEGDGWFSAAGCVCGSEACPWGDSIERCWFTPYLPDVRWQNAAAARAQLGDAAFWTERFDLDGVRIDAVPMMPRAASRRIAHELRAQVFPPSSSLLLGEIYTGPGTGAVDYLGYHLGPAGLDSVFDFPLMWALHDVVGRRSGLFSAVEAVLSHEREVLGAAADRLARILDNHDTPRFVTVAHGGAGSDPWSAPPEQPTVAEPYERAAIAWAILFTLPGMVVLYQGDEIGLAGAGDPDSRRVMPAEATLLPPQLALRAAVERLAALRRCSPALRRGGRTPLLVGSHRYAYLRDGTAPALVLVSTASEPTSVPLAAAELPAAAWQDAFDGSTFATADGALTVAMPALSFRVLLSPEDPCL